MNAKKKAKELMDHHRAITSFISRNPKGLDETKIIHHALETVKNIKEVIVALPMSIIDTGNAFDDWTSVEDILKGKQS